MHTWGCGLRGRCRRGLITGSWDARCGMWMRGRFSDRGGLRWGRGLWSRLRGGVGAHNGSLHEKWNVGNWKERVLMVSVCPGIRRLGVRLQTPMWNAASIASEEEGINGHCLPRNKKAWDQITKLPRGTPFPLLLMCCCISFQNT